MWWKILLYCYYIIISSLATRKVLDVAWCVLVIGSQTVESYADRVLHKTPPFFGFSTTNIPQCPLMMLVHTTIVIFGPISSCTGEKNALHQLRSMTSSDLESLPPLLKYPVIFRRLFFELFLLFSASIFPCNNALFICTLDSSTLSLRSLYWSGNIMLHMLAVLVSIRET